jgi:catechol 2,3-dioxygenase
VSDLAHLAHDQPTVVWTQAERANGQAWDVKTIEPLHAYGTPPVEAQART